MQLLFYPILVFFLLNVFPVFKVRPLLTHPSAVVEVVISYAMGTSDNTHVSNLKCCHYLMYFFCVGLFYYLMSCHLCCFSCRGHDRLRPNEMNLCSKPQTTCCTPWRNRFETVRQNIYIFLRGRSFSIFKLGVCSLILNL